jgi:hypothetical protein
LVRGREGEREGEDQGEGVRNMFRVRVRVSRVRVSESDG